LPKIIASTLGARITLELRNREMTVTDFLRQLQENYGKTFKIPGYAHILRVCKGETYPGPNLLPLLCQCLNIDVTEARRMVLIDKGIHSGATELVTGKDKQLLEFEEIWRQLSQSNKDELFMLAKFKLGVKVSTNAA
jgi:hypothetical protein